LLADKTLLVWNLTRDEDNYGQPKRALKGHSHFVNDVVISSDGQFALSASWGMSITCHPYPNLWPIFSSC